MLFRSSVADLIGTIRELTDTSLRFISLNEAFDLITPAGKALRFCSDQFVALKSCSFSGRNENPHMSRDLFGKIVMI